MRLLLDAAFNGCGPQAYTWCWSDLEPVPPFEKGWLWQSGTVESRRPFLCSSPHNLGSSLSRPWSKSWFHHHVFSFGPFFRSGKKISSAGGKICQFIISKIPDAVSCLAKSLMAAEMSLAFDINKKRPLILGWSTPWWKWKASMKCT